jgi:hypothetical protein
LVNGAVKGLHVVRRLGMALLGLVMLSCLSGCTALQLTYNNADTLLHWRGGKYFAFEDDQKAEFDRRVQTFLKWHRKSEIPKYAQMADDLATRLSGGVTQEDLVWGYDSFQTHLRQSARAGAGEMVGLLDKLSSEQIARFQERLEKDNREFANEHGLAEPAEERRARRVKRNVKRIEEWFGSLSDAQVERIAAYSRRAPLDDELRLKDRRRMQAELIAMLKKKEAKAGLVQWAVTWDKRRDPAYEALRKENLREYYGMLLDLDKTLTTEQRGKAVQRLRGFVADFNALAGQAGAR